MACHSRRLFVYVRCFSRMSTVEVEMIFRSTTAETNREARVATDHRVIKKPHSRLSFSPLSTFYGPAHAKMLGSHHYEVFPFTMQKHREKKMGLIKAGSGALILANLALIGLDIWLFRYRRWLTLMCNYIIQVRFRLFELVLTLDFKGTTLTVQRGSPDYTLVEPVLKFISTLILSSLVVCSLLQIMCAVSALSADYACNLLFRWALTLTGTRL